MTFGKLKQNGILSNNRGFAMRYLLKMTNSFTWASKTVILLFIVIFVSLITFCSKVKIRSHMFLDDP